jgi:Flp pilus assembly protein CpaB
VTRTALDGRLPSAGTVLPRRHRPVGRALAGGFAIAAALVLVASAYLDAQPARGGPTVVAATPLAEGTRLSEADLRTVEVRLPAGTAVTAFRSASSLVGRTLAVALAPGELLTSSELVPPDTAPALRPVPVSVPATDLVDLADGQRVDVLLTVGTAPDTRTSMLVRSAVVMSEAQPSGAFSTGGGSEVVTLGVASLAEVEAVISAEHAGTLDLVVGEVSDGSGLGSAP